jgi:hypothetical protein
MEPSKRSKSPITFALAVIVLCAVLYGLWHLYQQHNAESDARARFAAPVSSGVPDLLHAPPADSPLPP